MHSPVGPVRIKATALGVQTQTAQLGVESVAAYAQGLGGLEHITFVVGQGGADGAGLQVAQVEVRGVASSGVRRGGRTGSPGGWEGQAAGSARRPYASGRAGAPAGCSPVGHVYGKFHAVHQLPHVAGPVVVFQQTQGLGGKAPKGRP